MYVAHICYGANVEYTPQSWILLRLELQTSPAKCAYHDLCPTIGFPRKVLCAAYYLTVTFESPDPEKRERGEETASEKRLPVSVSTPSNDQCIMGEESLHALMVRCGVLNDERKGKEF